MMGTELAESEVGYVVGLLRRFEVARSGEDTWTVWDRDELVGYASKDLEQAVAWATGRVKG